MRKFNQISYYNLLDMLARFTTQYTQMLADNHKTEEFYKCKRLIEQLTSELELRKQTDLPDRQQA